MFSFIYACPHSVFLKFALFFLHGFISLTVTHFWLTFSSFLSDMVVVSSRSSPCHDHGDHSRWPSAPWPHHYPPPPPHLHRALPPLKVCSPDGEMFVCVLLSFSCVASYCNSFSLDLLGQSHCESVCLPSTLNLTWVSWIWPVILNFQPEMNRFKSQSLLQMPPVKFHRGNVSTWPGVVIWQIVDIKE